MIDDKTLFDQAVKAKKLGGRLRDDASERSDGTLQLIKDWEDRQIEGFRQSDRAVRTLPRVLVDYIDNPTIGGWAFYYGDSYIVSVTTGAIKTLRHMFNRLLASPDVFQTAGDVKKETRGLPAIPLTPSSSELESRIRRAGLGWEDFVPKDALRRSIADFMFLNGVLFLLGHEFRHIQGGHFDFGRNVLKFSTMTELPGPARTYM